mmetsp:Transcript_34585/g.73851  ORF Transcript_34585/g.73851 Transcript_34585/m.73851 type:complete len:248 (+) Transcript_34585:1347-2090(+)
MVRERYHIFDLPEDRAREAMQKVLERDQLDAAIAREECLHVPEEEGLVVAVDRIDGEVSVRARRPIRVPARLDDGVRGREHGRLKELRPLGHARVLGEPALEILGRSRGLVDQADVGLALDQPDGDGGHEAEGAVRPGQGVEKLGIRRLVDRVEDAMRVKHLVLDHRLLEEAHFVRVRLDAEAERAPADGDGLHLDMRLQCEAERKQYVGALAKCDTRLDLDGHGLDVHLKNGVKVPHSNLVRLCLV